MPSGAPHEPFRSHDAVTVLDPTLQTESRRRDRPVTKASDRSLWVPCTAQADRWTPGNGEHNTSIDIRQRHQRRVFCPHSEESGRRHSRRLRATSLELRRALSTPKAGPSHSLGQPGPGPGNQGSSALGLAAGSAGLTLGTRVTGMGSEVLAFARQVLACKSSGDRPQDSTVWSPGLGELGFGVCREQSHGAPWLQFGVRVFGDRAGHSA